MRIGKYSYKAVLAVLFLMGSANAIAATQLFKDKLLNCNPWNGFYITGQLGEAFNQTDWSYKNANFFNTLGATVLGNDFNADPYGLTVGGSGGFNYQTGPLVLGLEGGYLNTDLQQTNENPFFPTTESYTTYVHWMTTAKARVGYAVQQWLFSLNGGYAGSKVYLSILDAGAGIKANSSPWANGWTIGTSVDYKVSKHVALGVSYDYVKMYINNETISCPSCGTGVGFGTPVVDGDIQTQLVMAHLSYLFN